MPKNAMQRVFHKNEPKKLGTPFAPSTLSLCGNTCYTCRSFTPPSPPFTHPPRASDPTDNGQMKRKD